MNDHSVHNMQTYMAGQYLHTKQEKRLRMSKVLRRTTKKRSWLRTPEKAALITALIMVPLTYMSRGYLGFGSEWMVVAGVYLTTEQYGRWRRSGRKK